MAKRGRPRNPNAKREVINFRLRKDQAELLHDLSKKTGISRTDIFVDLMTREYERVIGKE